MQRILDIDVDFFVERVVYFPPNDGTRPADDEHPVWSIDRALDFLHERCALGGPVPGGVVERHHEVFHAWRDLVESGRLEPPFSVTHVDAHADLGLGDAGYVHLMEDILHRPVHDRTRPDVGERGLSEGNWLPFAIACRWLSELTFVFNDDRQSDVFVHHLENNDPEATNIQLKAIPVGEINRRLFELDRIEVVAHEPLVPYREVLWSDFRTEGPYDFIFLCRSPDYTPTSADAIFDAIRRRFVSPAR